MVPFAVRNAFARSLRNDAFSSHKVALNRKKDLLRRNRALDARGHRIGPVPAKSRSASFEINDAELNSLYLHQSLRGLESQTRRRSDDNAATDLTDSKDGPGCKRVRTQQEEE